MPSLKKLVAGTKKGGALKRPYIAQSQTQQSGATFRGMMSKGITTRPTVIKRGLR